MSVVSRAELLGLMTWLRALPEKLRVYRGPQVSWVWMLCAVALTWRRGSRCPLDTQVLHSASERSPESPGRRKCGAVLCFPSVYVHTHVWSPLVDLYRWGYVQVPHICHRKLSPSGGGTTWGPQWGSGSLFTLFPPIQCSLCHMSTKPRLSG